MVPDRIVAIGGSVGAIEVLPEIIPDLPNGFPAPVRPPFPVLLS